MAIFTSMIAKKRRKKNREFFTKPILPLIFSLIFLVIGGLLIYSNFKVAKRRQELNLKIKELNEEISVLEEQNKEFQKGLEFGLNEASLEKQARESFQLQKPGEKVVVVVATPSPSPGSVQEKESWWRKLFNKLGL